MGGLSIWHWLVFLFVIGIPSVIAWRSATLWRALAWCWAVTAILSVLVATLAMSQGLGIPPLSEWVGQIVYTGVAFSVVAAVVYGVKRLTRASSPTVS
jgi:hypothetical protein